MGVEWLKVYKLKLLFYNKRCIISCVRVDNGR